MKKNRKTISVALNPSSVSEVLRQLPFFCVWPVLILLMVLVITLGYRPYSGGDIGLGMVGVYFMDYILLAPIPVYLFLSVVYLCIGYFRGYFFPKYVWVIVVIISYCIGITVDIMTSFSLGGTWVDAFLSVLVKK
jgi:hypothetical protein